MNPNECMAGLALRIDFIFLSSEGHDGSGEDGGMHTGLRINEQPLWPMHWSKGEGK
ncbi:MAG: hypothetical protein ACJAS0_000461 [Alcanivorax borkumensis]|jgi:hypothetical protein